MSEEQFYEDINAKVRMSDDDFRKDAQRSFEFALTRSKDSKCEPEEPSIMPWLEVSYVTVEEGSGKVSERMMNVYALAVPDNEKRATMRRIGEELSKPGKNIIPVAAFFTAEAWVAARTGPMPKKGEKYVRPIDDPTSKDAIMLIASTLDRRVGTARQFVDKTKDGRTVPKGEPEWMWTMDGKVGIHPGVLVPLWEGFFARFVPLAEKMKAAKNNPNG
jgi:hypothetical protein